MVSSALSTLPRPEMDSVVTVKVRIHGKVQGVGYRAWTTATARELGLDGWVRNRHDGTVEALFKGSAKTVEAMIARCRKGPGLSHVDDIVREDMDGVPDKGFVHKPTV